MTDYKSMNGVEQAAAFNEMLKQAGTVKGFKPVKRFGSISKGVARLNALEKAINGGSSSPKKAAGKKAAKKVAKSKESGIREGTNKHKLFQILLDNKGKGFTSAKLQQMVYGSSDDKHKGPFSMCLGGLKRFLQETRNIPYEIVKTKDDDKEVTFALRSKG